MRRCRLAQPQRGSQVDVDHEPQRLGSGCEGVSWRERPDGVHQHVRGPNLVGDPIDEPRRHGGVGGVGHLAADLIGELTQPALVPVDRHYGEAVGAEGHRRRVTKRAPCAGHDRNVSAHLLLHTCLLDRVNGELANLLTGRPGSERILLDLEDANAFVLSLDPERTWFRYHHLFADLLRLELRRRLPEQVPVLHRRAAAWFAWHGQVADAIRHTQAADDWPDAARLLADHSFSLTMDGRRRPSGRCCGPSRGARTTLS
jgi:hypothetical protein